LFRNSTQICSAINLGTHFRFPPLADDQAGREVPETGHPIRGLGADLTQFDPKRTSTVTGY